jgi:integrase
VLERREACRPEWGDQDLVFPNRVGGPMDRNNLYYRDYKPLLKRAGLDHLGFTFHALRHTFAAALFERGQHPKIVQSLLGHSSITQTMDTYSHFMEGMGDDAVDGLDERSAADGWGSRRPLNRRASSSPLSNP